MVELINLKVLENILIHMQNNGNVNSKKYKNLFELRNCAYVTDHQLISSKLIAEYELAKFELKDELMENKLRINNVVPLFAVNAYKH